MTYPYVDGYDPALEMTIENGLPIIVSGGLLENGDPCIAIDDKQLTEDEVHVLVRSLMVNCEYARGLYFKNRRKSRNPIKPVLRAVDAVQDANDQ